LAGPCYSPGSVKLRLGRAVALRLKEEGYAVAVTGTRSEGADIDALRAEGIAYFQADIADVNGHEATLDAVEAELGPLCLLVNNAGRAPRQRLDLLETTPESMQELLQTNLIGPFFMTQKAARRMAERKKGCVVTISSVSAFAPSVNRGEYCISKAGLSMMTRLYAVRLAEYGIPVYEIQPGVIATDMTAGVHSKYDALIEDGLFPIARWGTPEDVAQAVALLASGKLPYSTGEVLHVDGGFHIQRL